MIAAQADPATTPTLHDGHLVLARLVAEGLPEPARRTVRVHEDDPGDTLTLIVELADRESFDAWCERLDSTGDLPGAYHEPGRERPMHWRAGRLSGVRALVGVETEHEPATYARPERRAIPLVPREPALSARGRALVSAPTLVDDASLRRLAEARERATAQLAALYPRTPERVDPRPTAPGGHPAPDPLQSGPGSGVADEVTDPEPTAAIDCDLVSARARLAEGREVWGEPGLGDGVIVTDAGVLDERAETWTGGEEA